MPRAEPPRPPIGGQRVGSAPGAPAPLTESWPELLPDAFALPAAIEAEQAAADEGPGPWPPVILDDPAEASPMPPITAAAVPVPSRRRRPLEALTSLFRRAKTRRAGVVSEYPVE
jgi:hypothetical protein